MDLLILGISHMHVSHLPIAFNMASHCQRFSMKTGTARLQERPDLQPLRCQLLPKRVSPQRLLEPSHSVNLHVQCTPVDASDVAHSMALIAFPCSQILHVHIFLANWQCVCPKGRGPLWRTHRHPACLQDIAYISVTHLPFPIPLPACAWTLTGATRT